MVRRKKAAPPEPETAQMSSLLGGYGSSDDDDGDSSDGDEAEAEAAAEARAPAPAAQWTKHVAPDTGAQRARGAERAPPRRASRKDHPTSRVEREHS